MDKNTPVFELEDIYYTYPGEEQPSLNGISTKVYSGESVCILGANGTGKSTLLKLLAGLLYQQKGVFKMLDREISQKSFFDNSFSKTYHQRVGFIFQNSESQLFCSTVSEEIAFGPLQLGLAHEEVSQRVEDVLNLLNISHLKNKTPFKLSGGEKKKAALACILALNPQVLILDEPTNGLDPRTQRFFVELLNSLNKAGKTIIVSTHNLELVQEISNRSIVFDESHKIVMDSSTPAVLEDVGLLKRVNLVDEYYHRHGDGSHAHYHLHNYK